ncbi:MAG: hydrolase, partial [Lachnospiraceae bacterium]|nr:hydrolase [Lachnospiraceae bacterium]
MATLRMEHKMRYINELSEGQQVKEIYLCKKIIPAQTKAGKTYWTVVLQDKTGTVDGKIWDPSSAGIGEFEALDYIWVVGEVTVFNGMNQLNIRQVRKAGEGEYVAADYLPCSERDVKEMYNELLALISSIQAP